MSESYRFGLAVLGAGGTGLLALFARRITAWTRIPAPLLLLVAAAVAAQAWPRLRPGAAGVEDIVTVALIYVLFEGGLAMGWREVRAAAGPIALLGVAATFLTVAGAAVFVHFAFGIAWFGATLLATAISPTDPAVVFSVLSGLSGRAMTILAGESGANDPVGIALMAALVAEGALGWGAFGHVAGVFVLQLVVGTALGVAGGRFVMWLERRVPAESGALAALRMALCVLLIFGVTVAAHGSGFLAVFLAGILAGDHLSEQGEVVGFHVALANLGEIVAFVVLGLSVRLADLAHLDVWLPGVLIAAVVAFVLRPLFVRLCLLRSPLASNERAFVIFGGLKGAVPILLGTMILHSGAEQSHRLFGIVVVVVIFSVLVQGTLIPTVARLLRLAPAPQRQSAAP